MRAPTDGPAVARWRDDTPGCALRVHLNNAGAALVPRAVRVAVDQHLDLEDELGGYEAAESRAEALRQVGEDLGRLVGGQRRNIALAQNSTVAFAQALGAFDFAAGDAILTSRADYASNQIMYLSLAARLGVEVIRAPDLPGGGVDPDAVRDLVRRRRPTLVALTWVPTNSGLEQDVAAVGKVCRAADVPYLVDACQAVGQLPVDVDAIGCDYLSATARKFLRGPRGIGFLYVADRTLAAGAHPLLVDMHGATWTRPRLLRAHPRCAQVRILGDRLRLGPRPRRGDPLCLGHGRHRDRPGPLARARRLCPIPPVPDTGRSGPRPRRAALRDRDHRAGWA